MKRAIIKITAMLVIVGLNWTGLSAVYETFAYMNDTETSNSNTFEAGTLDFSLSPTGGFSPNVTPTQSSSRTISVVKDGILGFQYTIQTSNETGTLCDSLNLTASRNGVDIGYTGNLKDFTYNAGQFSAPDNWQFTVFLIGSDPSLQGQTCTFDFVFDGTQIGGTGFFDQETISNIVTSGSWVVPTNTWVQTTQADFNAGIKTNVVVVAATPPSADNGDVKLATTGGVEELDQSQTTDDKDSGKIETDKFEAQTFTAGKSGKLVTVTIKAKKGPEGANPQPLVVELRNVNGGDPGSTILATAEISPDSFTNTFAEYNFTFSTPPDMASGSSYAIVVRQKSLTGTADYKIRIKDKGNLYTSGTRLKSDDGGSSWSVQTNDDIWFKTYVQIPITYLSPGTLVSQSFDSGGMADWQSLEWDETLPSGTDITLEVATSNNGSSWSAWQLFSSNSPIDLTSLPETRYIKWRATLTTTDIIQTPVLHEVRVIYYPGTASEHIVLNEFLVNPSGTNPDYGFDFGEDGDSQPQGEWVEIYNKTGGSAVDLAGWYIQDQEGNIVYITGSNTNTGSTVISSGGWLVVYMNGEMLNNDTETVYLYDVVGNLIDSYSYNLSTYCVLEPTPGDENDAEPIGACPIEIPGNKSYARIPDGSLNWEDPIPTPGKANISEKRVEEEIAAAEETLPVEDNDASENEEPILPDEITVTSETPIVEATSEVATQATTEEFSTPEVGEPAPAAEELADNENGTEATEMATSEEPVSEETPTEEAPVPTEEAMASTDETQPSDEQQPIIAPSNESENQAPATVESTVIEETPIIIQDEQAIVVPDSVSSEPEGNAPAENGGEATAAQSGEEAAAPAATEAVPATE